MKIHVLWLRNPLMKIGLILIMINFLPVVLPAFNNIPYFGVIRKVCLILGICCMLIVMFENKKNM